MNIELGNLLKEARAKKNISQRALAEIIGVSKSYINKMENGLVKMPSYSVLNRLYRTLDIDFIELMSVSNYKQEDLVSLQDFNQFKNFHKIDNEELFEKYIISNESEKKEINIEKVLKDYKDLKLNEEETIALFLEWMNL